jgi:hypothetical protein
MLTGGGTEMYTYTHPVEADPSSEGRAELRRQSMRLWKDCRGRSTDGPGFSAEERSP